MKQKFLIATGLGVLFLRIEPGSRRRMLEAGLPLFSTAKT
jgi:hypothetical protein